MGEGNLSLTLRRNSYTNFSVETLRYIIKNEAYVGDKLLQKKPPKDYLTKKPDPNREYYTAYLTDDHEAIIDRETWDKVQEILKGQKEAAKVDIHKHRKEHHVFYGKIFCGECGAPFIRRTYRSGSGTFKAWNCKERQKGRQGNGCKNRIIKEDELMQMVSEKLCGKSLDSVSKILVYGDKIEIE